MVGAHLQRLVTSHYQARLAILLMLQQSDVASASLFPLPRFPVELKQLGSHLENLLLRFFVCLGLDLLSEANDGLELGIRLSFVGGLSIL